MELAPFRELPAPPPAEIPATPLAFLQALGGPVALHLPGRKPQRARVLVTLTHGHETSGLVALHQWLREGHQPLTDTIIIIGGVEAALTEPVFYHRHPPQKRDLNRCFAPPYHDSQGQLARAILHTILQYSPEAIVDMHNTSCPSPAFAVCHNTSPCVQKLAGLFTDQMIISPIKIGTLMEQNLGAPVITFEAGGHQDPRSLTTARTALRHYLLTADIFGSASDKMTLFEHPLRLELAPQCQIGYAQAPLPRCHVTMKDDLSSLSFTSVGPDQLLGWVDQCNSSQLLIQGAHTPEPEKLQQYFAIHQGKLYPAHPMSLFMATTRADIAHSDCLLYFVCQEPPGRKAQGRPPE